MADELALDATGHDIHHAWRVFSLGLQIADQEGADGLVVGAAVLTHDLHRVVVGEELGGRFEGDDLAHVDVVLKLDDEVAVVES